MLELSGETKREELTCLGYNPALGQLEAVSVKQPHWLLRRSVPTLSVGYG